MENTLNRWTEDHISLLPDSLFYCMLFLFNAGCHNWISVLTSLQNLEEKYLLYQKNKRSDAVNRLGKENDIFTKAFSDICSMQIYATVFIHQNCCILCITINDEIIKKYLANGLFNTVQKY